MPGSGAPAGNSKYGCFGASGSDRFAIGTGPPLALSGFNGSPANVAILFANSAGGTDSIGRKSSFGESEYPNRISDGKRYVRLQTEVPAILDNWWSEGFPRVPSPWTTTVRVSGPPFQRN